MHQPEARAAKPKPVSRLASWFAADGGTEIDPDLGFIDEAQLCDLLHCLPSQLEAETESSISRLHIYFAAKALWQKREQAKQEQLAKQAQKGG